ncbi:MAG: tetratricopeptide repeat protein [Gammaproteobacteria bacterium]
MLRTGLIIPLAWQLISCASIQGREPGSPRSANDVAPQADTAEPQAGADGRQGGVQQQVQPLTQQMLFDVLLGEIAAQRGRQDVAVPHYLQAAEESSDPRIAERAVQMATAAGQYRIALRAARRWLALDSTSIEARKVITALALKLGDMDEVVDQLEYIIAQSGDIQQGFHLATATLARQPDKQQALGVMEQLAARFPVSAEAQLAVCRMAILANELDKALAAVEQAQRLQPELTQAYILKAQVLIRQDNKSRAVEVLVDAVKRYPEDTDLRFAYGRLLLDVDDLEGAKEQFRKVVQMAPDNADARYSLALLELETGEPESAEKNLKQLLEQGAKQQSVFYYLGYAAQERGDEDAALQWYGKVDEGEYWTQARLRMSKIMIKQGRLADVRREMKALRLNNPDNAVDFYLIEGQVLSDLAHREDAYSLYSQALESHPENEDLLYARALVAESMDRLDLAEQDMRHILEIDPDNVRTLNALGYTLADRTDRYDEALQYIQQAYAQDPDDPAIIDSMGWIQYRLGNLEQAREYLQRAYDMTNDGEIGAHLGEVLWMQGNRGEARRVWNESLKNAPDDPVLKEVFNRFQP